MPGLAVALWFGATDSHHGARRFVQSSFWFRDVFRDGRSAANHQSFPLRSEALSREREFLLDRIGSGDVPGTLAQPPLVEPVTVYERSPYNLRDASLQLPREYQDVQYLARELFPPEVKLYKHQFEALRLGIQGEDV